MSLSSNDAPLLEVRSLRFSPRPGLTHEVSFALSHGKVLQIRGASGQGKSSLLRVLARLSPPLAGELRLGAISMAEVRPQQWRRQVAYLAQRPVMLPGTVAENLAAPFAAAIARTTFAEQAARELLRAVALEPAQIWQQQAKSLSGGEAVRLALCRALLMQPALLLADEPNAGLDSAATAALVSLLSHWVKQGGGLVLVSHEDAVWQGKVDRAVELGPASKT